MRLLFLSTAFPQRVDPSRAPYNERLCRSLALTHRVGVVVPVRWIDRLKHGRRASFRAIQPDRPYAIEFPTFYYPPGTARHVHARFMERSIKSSVERVAERIGGLDALISYWTYPDGAAAAAFARRLGAPHVMIVGGSDVLVLARRLSHRALVTRALGHATAVVAVSRPIAEAVVALGIPPSRVHVVPRGVDTSVFHPQSRRLARERLGVQGGGPIILYAGRLAYVKGVDVLLDAARVLAADGVECRLMIAGDGPLGRSLARSAKSLAPTRLSLLGSLGHERLALWYAAADIVVVPSRSEGVPNVWYEAAACGVPIVASSVGGIPAIARDGIDRLVPPADPHALAAALKRTLTSPPPVRPYVVGTWGESAFRIAEIARSCTRTSMTSDAGCPLVIA